MQEIGDGSFNLHNYNSNPVHSNFDNLRPTAEDDPYHDTMLETDRLEELFYKPSREAGSGSKSKGYDKQNIFSDKSRQRSTSGGRRRRHADESQEVDKDDRGALRVKSFDMSFSPKLINPDRAESVHSMNSLDDHGEDLTPLVTRISQLATVVSPNMVEHKGTGKHRSVIDPLLDKLDHLTYISKLSVAKYSPIQVVKLNSSGLLATVENFLHFFIEALATIKKLKREASRHEGEIQDLRLQLVNREFQVRELAMHFKLAQERLANPSQEKRTS